MQNINMILHASIDTGRQVNYRLHYLKSAYKVPIAEYAMFTLHSTFCKRIFSISASDNFSTDTCSLFS